MKIHNIPGVMKAYNQRKAHSTPKTNSVSSKKDEMSLSNEAQILSKALQGAKATPEVREDKVNEIKNAIAQGTYSVTTEQVAEKMLKGALFNKKG